MIEDRRNVNSLKMDNYTEACATEPPNLDLMLIVYVRIPIMTLSTLTMLFTAISMIVLNRTRHTPKTARFLASGLLFFDLGTTLTFTVRKLVTNPDINRYLNIFGVGWSLLAYLNIGVMCVERLLVFQWPNFYLRSVTFQKVRIVCLCLWLTFFLAWVLSTGRCLFVYCTDATDQCFNDTIVLFIMVVCPTSVFVSSTCLMKIATLIKKQQAKFQNSPSAIKNHKSTFVVFLCFLNYVVTSLIYSIMASTVKSNFQRRIYMDGLMTINALLDSCVYVLWYKECRLELVKILAKAIPSLNSRIEKMKISIFDIPTASNSA